MKIAKDILGKIVYHTKNGELPKVKKITTISEDEDNSNLDDF